MISDAKTLSAMKTHRGYVYMYIYKGCYEHYVTSETFDRSNKLKVIHFKCVLSLSTELVYIIWTILFFHYDTLNDILIWPKQYKEKLTNIYIKETFDIIERVIIK